jgi:hypothetical protein
MSQRRVARRTFLQGVGLSVGLPLLEAMMPQRKALGDQQPDRPPVRIGFLFFPTGPSCRRGRLQSEGEGFEFTPTLKPLEPLRSHITSRFGPGTGQRTSQRRRAGRSCPGRRFVSDRRPSLQDLGREHPGRRLGRPGRRRPRRASDPSALAGVGDRGRTERRQLRLGYSCAYSSNISWKTETTPMAKEIHPRLVFERLFGSGDQASDNRKNAMLSGRASWTS